MKHEKGKCFLQYNHKFTIVLEFFQLNVTILFESEKFAWYIGKNCFFIVSSFKSFETNSVYTQKKKKTVE